MKALIVDDEPTVRLLLSRVLRREVDCTVSEASDGIEALDLLGREHFDFVVIDVMMPMMDGIETLEAIRGSAALRHLPVMVLSAVRDEVRVRQLVSLGISAYLTKPLRPSEAAARVQRFIAAVTRSRHPAGHSRPLDSLPDHSRILVIDGDEVFRESVRESLGQRYQVEAAESGAYGLRACLANPPAVIVLGQDLGAVPAPMFLRKLRTLPALAGVRVVLAGPLGDDHTAPEHEVTIDRNLGPEDFRDQFERLLTRAASTDNALHARPELRGQMVLAAEQVFGMLLGVEVVADVTLPATPATDADLVRIGFTLPDAGTDIEFGITMARGMSEQMTAILRQGADVVTDEGVAEALREVGSIVGVRIQNALRARGDSVTASAPVIGTVADAPGLATAWTPVGFHDAAGQVQFTAFLRPVERAAATVLSALEAKAS